MSVLKKRITEDFTVVHNVFIRDKNISIAERGLLLLMLSLPDNWSFSIAGLQALVSDGRDKVSNTLKALEKHGYLRRSKVSDEKGIIIDWEYFFSDEPIFLEDEEKSSMDSESCPVTVNPYVDNQQVEFPPVGYPLVGNTPVYKILSDKELKEQELINQTPCAAEAQLEEKKTMKSSSKKKDYDDEVYEDIISYLNDKAHTNYRAKAEGNRKYIRARLNEGYSVDDFRKVIDRKCAQWLNRPDMVIYLRPETLFGNKFDGYLNMPEPQKQPQNAQTVQQPGGKSMIELLNEYMEA